MLSNLMSKGEAPPPPPRTKLTDYVLPVVAVGIGGFILWTLFGSKRRTRSRIMSRRYNRPRRSR